MMGVGDLCQLAQVSHLHLRVGDDLQKDAACILVDNSLHSLRISQICKLAAHTEFAEGGHEQRERVAKKMLRCHNILALCRKCHDRIADSCHTTIERNDILCAGEGLDTFLKVGNRRIFTTGIVRCVDTVAKGIAHRLSIVKLIGYCIVHRHTECIVSVAPLIGHMYGLCLFLHHLFINNCSITKILL